MARRNGGSGGGWRVLTWLVALTAIAAGAAAIWGGSAYAGAAVLAGSHVPMLLGAWAAARGRRRGPVVAGDSAGELVLAGVLYLGGVIGAAMLAGVVGQLRVVPLFALTAALGIVLLWLGRRGGAVWGGAPPSHYPGRLPLRLLTLGFVLAAAVPGWAGREFIFDELTYHLAFPAEWVRTGRITLLPTWVGDPAPGYAPSAADVYYATLMLPLGEDYAARCGQFPFYLLLIVATEALGQGLGLGRPARAGLTAIVAGLPGIAGQACSAMVDVALAAELVSAAALALRLGRTRTLADACGMLLALGLAAGTKFVGLLYLLALTPLACWAAWRWWRGRRSGMAAPAGGGRLACCLVLAAWVGGYWYARNWIVTGNPVYPLRVEMSGQRLFDGPFGREQMANHIMNARRSGDWRGLGRSLWQAVSHPGREEPPADGGADALPVRRWLAGGPTAVAAATFGLVAAVAVLTFWRQPGVALYSLGTAAAIAAFWFGVPVQDFRYAWGPMVLMLAGAAGLARWDRSVPALIVLCGLPLLGLGGYAAVVGVAESVAGPGDPRARTIESARWSSLAPAWRFVDEAVRGKVIAYSGNNVPYLLAGRRLENRVVYVPARRPAHQRYDQWARAASVSSPGTPHTSEPAFDRWEMDPAAWMENLREAGVDYFVVNSLEACPNLVLNVRHDDAGFPVERQWLDALVRAGAAEEILLPSRSVRVYRVHRDRPGAPPVELRPIRQEETDALHQLQRLGLPPGATIAEYPLAGPYIERHSLKPLAGGREP